MTSPTPPYAPPTAPALPRDPRSPAARFGALGLTCIALGALEIAASLQRLVGVVWSGAVQSAMAPLTAASGLGDVEELVKLAQKFSAKIAPWEALRLFPFIAASGVLIWLGLRLRAGDATALPATRRWAAAAFAIVGLSAALQALVIVPAGIAQQKAILAVMMKAPTPAGAPFEPVSFASGITLATTLVVAVGGVLIHATWPAVLILWSRRLERRA